MSRTLTFKATPDVWEELKANVSKETGLTLSGNEGQGKAKGIEYSYKYDPSTETLSIEEISRSFYDPSEDVIEQKIHDAVESILPKS